MRVLRHWKLLPKEVMDSLAQGNIGWGFEEPELAESVSAQGRVGSR